MNKKTVAGFFNDYAEGFDAIYGSRNTFPHRILNTLFRRSMRLRFERTVAGCEPLEGRSVLDIGCGSGHYSVYLAKMGAAEVVGIDFAEQMLTLAKSRARHYGMADRCTFTQADFTTWETSRRFDYSILMGFMDYVEEAHAIVARALSLTNYRAFFSFPVSSGILAWQRRVRYRQKCDLCMYNRKQIAQLFDEVGGCSIKTEKIARDYFVTASVH